MFKLLLIISSVLFFMVIYGITFESCSKNKIKEHREQLARKASNCFENGDLKCAEIYVDSLLQAPYRRIDLESSLCENAVKLKLTILYKEGRYKECATYDNKYYAHDWANNLKTKCKKLQHELESLHLEQSYHFALEFDGNPNRNDILEALSVLEVAYDSLCNLFDFRPENKMQLVLYESKEFQGGTLPNWAGAVFDGKLRVPVKMMRYRSLYRPTLFHELTHLFVQSMSYTRIPSWVNEGIAQVIDGTMKNIPRPAGKTPNTKDLTLSFAYVKDSERAKLFYWFSDRMVRKLLERNNSFVYFKDFICSLKTLEFDNALEKFYGVSTWQLLTEVGKFSIK